MNSKLGRKQVTAVIAVVVFLFAAGSLAWLGLGNLSERQAEAAALAERIANPALAGLLSQPAGVVKARQDIKGIQKLETDLYESAGVMMSAWSQATHVASGAGQEWSTDPGKWKDRLIEIQSQLQKTAPTRKVQLDSDFYLGLESYRQKSPGAGEVPNLAVHLSVAERLIDRLMEARQVGEQFPTVCEVKMLSGPGSVQEKSLQAPLGTSGGQTEINRGKPERKKFRIEVRCSPEVLYEYVRLLVTDAWLFIITEMSVTNDKLTFPLRSEIAKKLSAGGGSESGAPPKGVQDKKLLEILAGEEGITASLEVDFVEWTAGEKNKAAGTPPAQNQ